MTIVSGSWIVGFILVLLSKWRIFAVRPRYYFLNIKSNLVDLIVGFSFVLMAYFLGVEVIPAHYILMALYSLWLTVVKPKTTEAWNLVQAEVAIFMGTAVASILSAALNSAILVLIEFVVGYGAARHVLAQNNYQKSNGYPAMTFGLMFAEVALIMQAWNIVYVLPETGMMVPQLAIIMSLVGFACERMYRAVEARDGELRMKDVAMPLAFSLVIIGVILIVFSEPLFNV